MGAMNHMYIKVRVTPEAKKEHLKQEGKDHFKISVKEPAKQNLANRRVVELIAAHFVLAPGLVRIVSGHHSASKILWVETPE